ncbi:DUF2085 domain-containing protein [Niallia oryzisoli]|uniref:DUF2085 domain-containing protein n=1 Tax=Niallia oryzisoli TaxID=1737571 RepID=UPI0037361DB4
MEERSIGKEAMIACRTVMFRIVMGVLTVIAIVDLIVIKLERVFEVVPCHRMKSRSLTIRGYTLPICARCTGILAGYLFFPILLIAGWNVPLWLGILLNFPMIIDGWTQKRKYRMSTNTLRLATGLVCGFGQSIIIVGVSQFIIAFVL